METAAMIKYYQNFLAAYLPKWYISQKSAMTQLTEFMPGAATEMDATKNQQNNRHTSSSL